MSITVERMDTQLDWLYKPVDAGYFTADKLLDGTFSLHHIADMCDVIDVRDENERRASAAMRNA